MALGPLVVALPRLFLLLAIGAALLVAHVVERRTGTRVESPLWWSLLVGLIAARVAYVLTHLADFEPEPWQALAFWQDGYSPLVGVLAAIATAMFFALRRSFPARQLFAPLIAGLTVWGGLLWVMHALQQGRDQPLPDVALADLSGAQVSLAGFRGGPVVLNLWASWCPPCRREMPVLAEAQQENPGIRFVFVNSGENPATVRQYLSAERLDLRNVLVDLSGQIQRQFDAPGLPTTLFFDSDGSLVDTHLGELSRARLGDYLRKLSVDADRRRPPSG